MRKNPLVRAIRILFARSAPSHPILLFWNFRRYTKWRIFNWKNVRRVVLLEINGKNSTKRARNEVFMTTESSGFKNLGRLGFRL